MGAPASAQLPAVRLTVIERCGHVPQLECPERFREASLRAFQAGLEAMVLEKDEALRKKLLD